MTIFPAASRRELDIKAGQNISVFVIIDAQRTLPPVFDTWSANTKIQTGSRPAIPFTAVQVRRLDAVGVQMP